VTSDTEQGAGTTPSGVVRIYLADDHAVFRDGLRLLLEAEPDITVVGDAAEGRKAAAEVEALRPDVVVLDIGMPGLNGIEAARRIRERCPDAGMVILSMHGTSEHIYQALSAGAQAYVLKESAGTEVVEAIRSVMAGRRYLSRKISDVVVEDYLGDRNFREPRSPIANLTHREREVLQLVVEGRSSREIASMVHLSPKTVDTYRCRLMQKLGVQDIPALVKFCIRHGITPQA